MTRENDFAARMIADTTLMAVLQARLPSSQFFYLQLLLILVNHLLAHLRL